MRYKKLSLLLALFILVMPLYGFNSKNPEAASKCSSIAHNKAVSVEKATNKIVPSDEENNVRTDANQAVEGMGGGNGNNGGPAATESDMINEVLRLVNDQRAAVGLPKLTYRSDLQKAADIRAREIVKSFSHTRPNGTSFDTVFKEIGVTNYKNLGENIATGYNSPEAVMNGWMNSEGHRANILNPDFKGIIVGIKKTGNNGYAWVQLFITQ